MAKTQRAFVFLTFLVSCTCVILAIVSMATENWITGEVIVTNQIDPNTKASIVYYGLFAGTFEKYILATPTKATITTVCLVSENICMLSTEADSDARSKEIQDFHDGKCDGGTTACGKQFLNAGLWIMTIFFLVLSLFMGIVSAMFSVVNTATNPVHQLTSIFGLYIWNGVAAASYVLTMIMWGAQYEQYAKTDVAITDTVAGSFKNNDQVHIGYSCWLIFGPLFLHIANIGILFLRQYLISKQPKTPTIKQDTDKDGMLFVY